MKKRWIAIVVVNFLLFVSGLSFLPVGYIYSNIVLVNFGVGIAFLLAFSTWIIGSMTNYDEPGFLDRLIFRVLDVETLRRNTKDWLLLHWLIQLVEIIGTLFFFSLLSAVWQLAESGLAAYILAYFILISMLIFPFFQSVRKLLGMGYDETEGGSLFGVKAVARLSSILLKQRSKRGIEYLSKTLYMLNRCLRYRNLSLKNLDKARIMLSVIEENDSEAELEQAHQLSDKLYQEPLLTSASKSLEVFVRNKKLSWAAKFDTFSESKRSWIQIVTIAAALSGTSATVIQAVLPEMQKEAVLNFLSQFVSSPNIFMLFPIVVLFYGLIRYLGRVNATWVRLGDIRKIKDDEN